MLTTKCKEVFETTKLLRPELIINAFVLTNVNGSWQIQQGVCQGISAIGGPGFNFRKVDFTCAQISSSGVDSDRSMSAQYS